MDQQPMVREPLKIERTKVCVLFESLSMLFDPIFLPQQII